MEGQLHVDSAGEDEEKEKSHRQITFVELTEPENQRCSLVVAETPVTPMEPLLAGYNGEDENRLKFALQEQREHPFREKGEEALKKSQTVSSFLQMPLASCDYACKLRVFLFFDEPRVYELMRMTEGPF